MTTELVIDAIKNGKNLNTPNNLKFPCSICNKNVLNNQKAIQCDSCNKWCHIKCDGTYIETYNKLMISEDELWNCLLCTIKFNHYTIPFTLCDDIEIQNLNNRNMRFCQSLPNLEILTEVSKFSNQSNNEVDYNLPILSTCKYYSVNEIQNLKCINNFNIFHSNINGLGSKFDNLYEFISSTSAEFDIIVITETCQKRQILFNKCFY